MSDSQIIPAMLPPCRRSLTSNKYSSTISAKNLYPTNTEILLDFDCILKKGTFMMFLPIGHLIIHKNNDNRKMPRNLFR